MARSERQKVARRCRRRRSPRILRVPRQKWEIGRGLAAFAVIAIVCVLLLGNPTQDGTQQYTFDSGGSTSSEDGASEAANSYSDASSQLEGGYSDYITVSDVPDYSGSASVTIAGGEPAFDSTQITTTAYEYYGELDSLGRCTYVIACVGPETMPTTERGDISEIHPTGWVQGSYDFVSGGVLYNRCHLIGFQLTGEDANERNLITGTRYMNVEGMLPYENIVADYVDSTGNHVIYRVTPIFEGDNLLASGVHMEALSVEDDGAGVSFNVYCYNVQPGVEIDYATGENWAA